MSQTDSYLVIASGSQFRKVLNQISFANFFYVYESLLDVLLELFHALHYLLHHQMLFFTSYCWNTSTDAWKSFWSRLVVHCSFTSATHCSTYTLSCFLLCTIFCTTRCCSLNRRCRNTGTDAWKFLNQIGCAQFRYVFDSLTAGHNNLLQPFESPDVRCLHNSIVTIVGMS